MLVEFRVENHRSIREEQGLTLEAGNVDGDTMRLRDVAGLRLLPVAAFTAPTPAARPTCWRPCSSCATP